jgi:hypothetical protein
MKQTLISSTPTVVTRMADRESAVRTVAGEIEASSGASRAIGSVASVRNDLARSSKLRPVSFKLDNSAGGSTTTFLIGDPTGLVEEVHGLTPTAPVGQKVSHDVFKETLRSAPIAIKSIQYKVKVDASQFSEQFEYLIADIDTQKNSVIEDPSSYERNNQENDKLLTLDFETPLVMNWQRALKINVAAGETVTLTFYIGLAANR